MTNIASTMQIAAQHLQAGRLREAEDAYREILGAQPENTEVLFNLAIALTHQRNRYDEAIELYRKVLELKPGKAEALNNLGGIYLLRRELDESLSCFRQALALRPNVVEIRNNIGNVLKDQGKPEEALESYRNALKRKPGDPIVLNNIGEAYRALNRYEDAVTHFRKALAIKPDFAQAKWNLGLVSWMQGDLAGGLRLYETRFDKEHRDRFAHTGILEVMAQLVDKPRWRGESLQGKTLMVWTEQGMGDSLMMMRYLPLLQQKGAKSLIVLCDRELVKLMLTVTGLVVDKSNLLRLESFDVHCSMMSLPHLFGTTLETIPTEMPYIHASEAGTQKWAKRLNALPGLKVGLVWAGSPFLKNDNLRSMDLSRMAPLFSVPEVRFISLQKGDPARQLKEGDWPILDFISECDDFMDTAALIANLDLVISVDTAVAHLAGAMGKPVWLLNRFESEWRWMLEREDSPWYPGMRIFRQPALHDWDSVIARVAEVLRELAGKN